MSTMPIICLFFGFLLNLTAFIGCLNTGSLQLGIIPCALGLILILCGLLGRHEKLPGRAILAALVVGLIGFTATASGFLAIPLVLRKTAGIESAAILSKSATALLCGLFVGRCVQSFLQARRVKKQDGAAS